MIERLVLRPMTSADRAEIKAWPSYGGGFEQMDYALRDNGWLDEFRGRPNTFFYAAGWNGRTIGFSLLSAAAGDEAEFRIAVHPELTGKGLGKDVARATLKIGFQQLHLARIHLIVRKNNPRAAKLYRSIGFSIAGESVHTIQGNGIEFIDMNMTREQYNDLNLRGGFMNTALLLVDIQQDYFPGGRMEVVGAVEATQAAGRLLALFRSKNLPVFHIQHVATRPNATFLLPHTEGIAFHENVKPLPGETVIVKHFPNSFRDTDLEQRLSAGDVKKLVVCGMMSHMCIDTTVRAAFDKGYACTVVHDACATRDMTFDGTSIPAKHVHGAYMSALGAVFATVSGARDIAAILG